MNYDKIRLDSDQFMSLTSLKIEEFDELLEVFRICWEEYAQTYRYDGKRRQNRAAAQGRGKLPTAAHKLFFILVYYKTNMIQQVLGASFGMNQSQANKWIKKIEFVLHKSLAYKDLLPTRTPEALYDLLVEKEEKNILLDGVERLIPRSTDYEQQKEDYSGKKKTHTSKNNVVTNFSDKILYLSPTYLGKTHDKKICNENPLLVPGGTYIWQDTGFQGHAPENAIILQPIKKKKDVELTDLQKRFNKSISRIRVYVEHAIAGVKRLRIVKDKLRNLRQGCRDLVMEIACGLHNFRIFKRPDKKQPSFYCSI